jgi:hypothetical protein
MAMAINASKRKSYTHIADIFSGRIDVRWKLLTMILAVSSAGK